MNSNQSTIKIDKSQDIPYNPHVNCDKCGGLCPSGTLDNGLCLDCNQIGSIINVAWGKFGVVSCRVDHVSRNGIVYACRWNKSAGKWTAPQPVTYYKGYHLSRYDR